MKQTVFVNAKCVNFSSEWEIRLDSLWHSVYILLL